MYLFCISLPSEVTHRKQTVEAEDRDAREGKRWALSPADLNTSINQFYAASLRLNSLIAQLRSKCSDQIMLNTVMR